jgi:class 3 adenylate cyclase
VHQFQGDGMLVTFNLPIADPRHADKAVKTAAEIQRAVNNRTFAGLTLRTRIGVNTGEVTAGNVGSGDRVSYTVHGDAVNLSARIEQLNKEHGTYVLVSGTTVELLQDDYPLRAVGEVDIRGKTEPVTLYHLETTDQE